MADNREKTIASRAFFAAIRPLFGGALSQSQVDGVNYILTATKGLPKSYRAYLLATTHHETAKTMMPVRETLANTDRLAIVRRMLGLKRDAMNTALGV